MRNVLVLLALLVTACGSSTLPTSEDAVATSSTALETTTVPATTTALVTTAVATEPPATTTTEPPPVNSECEPLIEESIARTQGVIDEVASMSLDELANSPEAPSVVTAWWAQEPTLVEGTYLSDAELSAEELAEIEATQALYETCVIAIFLAPYTHADQLDLQSASGAIAWSEDFTIRTFIPFDFEYSPEAQAEVEAAFGDVPTPSTPDLGSPSGLSCPALQAVVVAGAQSLIDTYQFRSWEIEDEVEAWIEDVDQAATDTGCGELFFATTVASNGHLLTAKDMFEVPNRAAMLSFAWQVSWESFRN